MNVYGTLIKKDAQRNPNLGNHLTSRESRGHDGPVHRRAGWHDEARVGQGASLGRFFLFGVGFSGLVLRVCSFVLGFGGFRVGGLGPRHQRVPGLSWLSTGLNRALACDSLVVWFAKTTLCRRLSNSCFLVGSR